MGCLKSLQSKHACSWSSGLAVRMGRSQSLPHTIAFTIMAASTDGCTSGDEAVQSHSSCQGLDRLRAV